MVTVSVVLTIRAAVHVRLPDNLSLPSGNSHDGSGSVLTKTLHFRSTEERKSVRYVTVGSKYCPSWSPAKAFSGEREQQVLCQKSPCEFFVLFVQLFCKFELFLNKKQQWITTTKKQASVFFPWESNGNINMKTPKDGDVRLSTTDCPLRKILKGLSYLTAQSVRTEAEGGNIETVLWTPQKFNLHISCTK